MSPEGDDHKGVEKPAVVVEKVSESAKKDDESSSSESNQQHHDGEDDEDSHHHDEHGSSSNGKEGMIAFFSNPRQRQRWGDTQVHPHKDWGDIFFDLFFVAAAYNLGNVLREDPTKEGLLFVAGCFLPMKNLWDFKLYYDARYYTQDDIYHHAYQVALLVAIGTCVLHIRPVAILADPNSVDMFAFSLSLLVANCLSIGRMVEIMICQKAGKPGLYPEAYTSARRDMLLFIIPALWYLAASVYSGIQFYGGSDSSNEATRRALAEESKQYDLDNTAIWLCLSGFLTNTVFMGLMIVFWFKQDGSHKTNTVPMNINYAIHRYGEWTMLMLGETVLSLLIVDLSDGPRYYQTFFSGIMSIILLEYLHFRSQPHDPDEHAMRRDKNAAYIFSVLMSTYSLSLIVLGASYKMFLFEFFYDPEGERRMLLPMLLSRALAGGESAALRFDTEDRQQRIAHFFSGSMALVWFCMDTMAIVHRGLSANMHRCECESEDSKKTRYWVLLLIALRVALIGFIASLSQYVTAPDTLAVVGLAGIIGQLLLRVLGSFAFPIDEEEAEEKVLSRIAADTAARVRDA